MRDLFVRGAGPRPAPTAAAGVMWARTRTGRGPNEAMVRADTRRQPGAGWQLCYRVNNFAPSCQFVAVEQRRTDGIWEARQACHTIEFQSRAARARGGLTREHAAPIAWDGDAKKFPRLRLVLRGIGQVKLEDVELTDGRTSWRVRLGKKILGRPAPRRGWPDLDWSVNRDVQPLALA